MSNFINVKNSSQIPFNSFNNAQKVKRGFVSYRYHNRDTVETRTKIQALAGSMAGVALSCGIIAKHQKIKLSNPLNIFKLKYGIKEMIAVSGLGVIGGVLGGMICSDKKKEKVDEGVFQFMNASAPLLAVHPAMKLLDNSKSLKENKPVRIIATLVALLLGMKGAAVMSNYINDPHDLVPDRKLTMKDAIANMDDALGAFAVAKIPCADKVEKILPLIYVYCGYRAGQNN